MFQKGYASIITIVGLIILAGITSYFLFVDRQSSPELIEQETTSAVDVGQPTLPPSNDVATEQTTEVKKTNEALPTISTANWKTFEVPGWGVIMKYPPSSFVVRNEGIYENAKLFNGRGLILLSNYQNPNYSDPPDDFWQMQIDLYPQQMAGEEVVSQLKPYGTPIERNIGNRTFLGADPKYEEALGLWTSGWRGYWNNPSKDAAVYVSFPPAQLLNESVSEEIIKSITFTSEFDNISGKANTAQYLEFLNVPSGLVLQKGSDFTIRWKYNRTEDLPVRIFLVDPTGKRLGNIDCCDADSKAGTITWTIGNYTPYANAAEREASAGIGYSFEIQLESKDGMALASYRSNTFAITGQ